MASSLSQSDVVQDDQSSHSLSLRSDESTCIMPVISSVTSSSACESNRNVDGESGTQECDVSQSSIDFPAEGNPENCLINAISTLPIFDKRCTTKTKLIRPLYKYIENNQCQLCGFQSNAKDHSSIKRHLLVHVSNKEFKCDSCDKTFRSLANLKNHRLTHKDEFPYSCDLCSKKFRSKDGLSNHKRKKHGEKRKFKCDFCDKVLCTKVILKQHLRIHTGERPYGCSLCKKSFRLKCLLSRHLHRDHGVDKKHQFEHSVPTSNESSCSSAIGSSTFKTEAGRDERSSLAISLSSTDSTSCVPLTDSISRSSACENDRVHTETCAVPQSVEYAEDRKPANAIQIDTFDPPSESDKCTDNAELIRPLYKYIENNKCLLCGFESKAKYLQSVRNHLFVHVTNQKFKCDVCDKKFPIEKYLITHRLCHREVLPFSCDLCDKKYRIQGSLTNHKIKRHGERPKFKSEV